MKYIIMALFSLIPLLSKSQTTQNINPENKNLHSSINAAGGDISSEDGSVSYSIKKSGGTAIIGNNAVHSGGLFRKTANNS